MCQTDNARLSHGVCCTRHCNDCTVTVLQCACTESVLQKQKNTMFDVWEFRSFEAFNFIFSLFHLPNSFKKKSRMRSSELHNYLQRLPRVGTRNGAPSPVSKPVRQCVDRFILDVLFDVWPGITQQSRQIRAADVSALISANWFNLTWSASLNLLIFLFNSYLRTKKKDGSNSYSPLLSGRSSSFWRLRQSSTARPAEEELFEMKSTDSSSFERKNL